MTNVHITGDRTMSTIYPSLVAIEMLRTLAAGDTISTGASERGVDLVVTELARLSGVEVITLGDEDADRVVYVHTDPHTSSRLKAFADLGDDALRIVTPADLLV